MDTFTIKELADLTRFEENQIRELWENPYMVVNDISEIEDKEQSKSSLIIKTFSIPKRNNPEEVRRIYYPHSQKLKTILKIISRWLLNIYTPPDVVHGFVKTRGIKTNAEKHLNCKYLLKLDLKNYYEQIEMQRIAESLVKMGISDELSQLISKICTIEGKLIQGFSTSPVISNIVSTGLDSELQKYCLENNISYTRYADDMSFSSTTMSLDHEALKLIIENFGFEVNDSKTRVSKRGFYQSVTGLTIFDQQQPRIPKRIKRNLRLEVYYIKKFGIKNHAIRRLVKKGKYNNNPNAEEDLVVEINETRERIKGWINFSKGIEPEFSSKILKAFEER